MTLGLGLFDWLVVGLYFAFVTVVAVYSSGRQRDTRDFFLGDRSLPWWAATLSIVATETSAVTFIGVPAMAYRTGGDWSFLQLVLGFVLGRVFLAFFFIKAFYRDDYETVYGYLGWRFGPIARWIAALFFLAGRIAGSGVRLLAGCIALGVALSTSGDPESTETIICAAVVVLGIVATTFTLIGGIRTVVWTDVILGVTLLAAGLFAALTLYADLSETDTLNATAMAERMSVFHFGWDLSDGKSLLAGIVGGFFLTLATHGTDQDIVQRMLTCRDGRSGSLSVLGSAVLILPLFALFLLVGTLLFFFYQQASPAYELPPRPDYILPVYIVRELPTGLAGFVLAGLLAASLSSLTSVLNALAATTVSDFYRPLRSRKPPRDADRHYLNASRVSTLAWGVVLVVVALVFYGGNESIVTMALSVLTYFYGGLLGAFLLGIFTSRGNSASVFCGMLLSVPAVLLLQLRQYLAAPENAPSLVRDWLDGIPADWQVWVVESVPDLTWHYWIIVGAAITVAVGLLGSRPLAQRYS